MEFRTISGVLMAFDDFGEVDDGPLGHFVLHQGFNDNEEYFYFRPMPGVLLSHRQCRKASEKLAELNVERGNRPATEKECGHLPSAADPTECCYCDAKLPVETNGDHS